ncbi:hypothetical protein NQ318_020188 [Aromia moschata]|uniref:Uncharacterized protein n=1 Tax=Aromia moschata TaxID=1265417 RepID=A0AAV8ZBC8_9CUCU|nr:hypothetical protein NQ318_020188 [Aromia moschata]
METEAENDNKLFQNSIKYLHSISNVKALNVPALKSFYSTKGRLMELRNAIYLPFNLTRTSVRCQRCLINLSDGPASYKIKAQEKKSKFARKVLGKFHRDKPLTKYQRKYIKHLDEFNGNHLAITCKFCKKESLIKLEKPKKTVRSKGSKNIPQKKKRIKKKDKFCGLNEEAVLSLTPQNVRGFRRLNVRNKRQKNLSF